MGYLEAEKILLTGAAGGFGTHFVRLLLQRGAHLVLSGRDDPIAGLKNPPAGGLPGRIIGAIGADLSEPGGANS